MKMIDADALNEAFDSEGADLCVDYGESCEWGFSYNLVHDLIGNAPTIDVEPVQHGHWITFNVIDTKDRSSKIRYMCNKCGRYEDEQEPYCNCGAKMDEVSE